MDKLKETSKKINVFVQLSHKTGVPPEVFLIGSIVILFFMLLTSLESILQDLILIAYPLILTYRHLGKDASTKKEEAEKASAQKESSEEVMKEGKAILLFWAASGSFFLIDKILSIIFGGSFFYNMVKISLLVWMVYPGSTLPKKTVEYVISPVMAKYGSSIDQFLDIIKKTADDTISKISETEKKIRDGITEKGKELIADQLTKKAN